MAHLGDRITDYVFGEMTTQEFTATQDHLRECSDCVRQVEELRRTHNFLQAVPDAEPPRPIIFEVERKPAWKPWLWKWAAPAAAALAASVLTAALMSPTQARFEAELEKRDQAHQMDLEGVRREIAYWEKQQRAVSRESLETAAAVQVLAGRYLSKTDGD
jgi:anti-sigma factor RsiW